MVEHPQIRDYSPEDAAGWLCSLGMSVFPLEPRDKRPAKGFSWQSCQTARLAAARVCELAERHPGCNWGVALGPVSDAVVIDADDDNARTWVLEHYLPTPWITKTGKGWHFWYRYPHDGEVANQNLRSQGVSAEIKSAGTYVVAPQSVHPSGAVYTLWTKEGADWDSVPEFAPLPSAENVNLAAAADLESVEACFSAIIKGDRNNTLARYAGRLVAAGLPFEEVKARVLAKNENFCEPPLSRREAVGVACSVYRTHQRNHPPAAKAAAQDGGASEKLTDMTGVALAGDDAGERPWPEEMLHPGGLLERIMAYTEASSIRTRPVYSLAGAIALLGTLAGQRVKTETGLTTNVYIAVLGPSASGKDAPKRAVTRLLSKVALEALGDSDVASDSAIISRLERFGGQRALFVLDEIGGFFRACKNPTSPRAGVAKFLTEIYSRYDTPYTKGYADRESAKTLWWQCLSVIGLGNPMEFWASMQDGEATNGFLARMDVFEDSGEPGPRNRHAQADPPEDLLEDLQAVWAIDGGELNPETRPKGATPLDCIAKPKLVPMTDEAWDFHDRMTNRADALMVEHGTGKTGPAAESIYGRLPERAMKMALIFAVSRLGGKAPEGRIELEDMRKAWILEMELAGRLVDKLRTALHASDFELWCNMAEDAIRQHAKQEKAKGRPKPGAPRHVIEKALPVPARIVKEVIDKMVASNRLRLLEGWKASERSRRPLDLYCIVREVEEEESQ